MNDQCRDETPRGALTEQLELDLPDDGSFFCTRACEGVSVSPGHEDAELCLSPTDMPPAGMEVSVARQNPVSNEKHTVRQEMSDDQYYQALDGMLERFINDSYGPVLCALWEALAEAGLCIDAIAAREDSLEGRVVCLIEDIFEDFFVETDPGDSFYENCLENTAA